MKTTRKYFVLKSKETKLFYKLVYVGDEYRDWWDTDETQSLSGAEHYDSLEELKKEVPGYTIAKYDIVQVTEVIDTKRRYKRVNLK